MVYKLLNEPCDYICNATGERKNLLEANWAETPEGLNVGWTELENMDAALAFFNVRYEPLENPIETL